MFDLVIKNGTVVTANESVITDVGITGEKISAIGANLVGSRVIDAASKLVTPGAVDIHVHLEMPIGKFSSTDDFYSGTKAAAYGGTTTIVDFVERRPEETMVEAIAARRALADPKVLVDYSLHMTLGPGDMDVLNQVPAAYEAGCTSFKLYMAYGLRLQDGEIYEALTAVKNTGGMPVIHAENWDIICTLIKNNLHAGRISPKWHPRSRPSLMEAEAVGRAIDIATLVGTPIHIFHVSTGTAVERIAAARENGLPVTAETCPQYLFLTSAAYEAPGALGTLPVCSPPIRAQEEQDALWEAVAAGNLQVISTDHCPFTKEEKATGLQDYSQIPGGVPSIEMRFSAIYDRGVRPGLITENQWVDLCCTQPAAVAGLSTKGQIRVGNDADLVIFDPSKTHILSTKTLHETAGWTPYEGMTMNGWPEKTISRGQLIVDNNQLNAAPGRGKFIMRGRTT